MGTSKRNLTNEIKKLLKDKPFSEINETAPELTKKILTKKVLLDNFDQEDTFDNSIRIITNHFVSLKSNGFKGKSRTELAEDPITQQEFLELILDQIEESTIISSAILEKSLKIVMCKFLEKEQFDTYAFSQMLFYEIVYQILLGQLHDNIKDIYDEIDYKQIEGMVVNVTNQIMNTSVYSKVNQLVDRKITLTQVLEEIASQTSVASFGEF
jgi:hypothetical protein